MRKKVTLNMEETFSLFCKALLNYQLISFCKICLMGLSCFKHFIGQMSLKSTKMVNWERSVQGLQCVGSSQCVGIFEKKRVLLEINVSFP